MPGIAILTSQIERGIIQLLAQKDVCAVYLDLGRIEPLISNIVIDCEHGIAEALGHLRALGHRRIAFIGGPTQLHSARRRRSAFLTLAEKSNDLETWSVDADFTVQGGYHACAKRLAHHRPTAILAANDLMAIGSMHCGDDRGLRIPADLSIVGFDDITFAKYTHPSLTTVHVPRSRIGYVAFDALWTMLSERSRAGQEYRTETHLVVRASTAPHRNSA